MSIQSVTLLIWACLLSPPFVRKLLDTNNIVMTVLHNDYKHGLYNIIPFLYYSTEHQSKSCSIYHNYYIVVYLSAVSSTSYSYIIINYWVICFNFSWLNYTTDIVLLLLLNMSLAIIAHIRYKYIMLTDKCVYKLWLYLSVVYCYS